MLSTKLKRVVSFSSIKPGPEPGATNKGEWRCVRNVEYLNVWDKTPTLRHTSSASPFSFSHLHLHLLLLHCVETIFILRVPQSQHNWCRNARSESINPFYPSVTPLSAHLSLSSLHRTGLFCTLYTAYKLQLITVSCELKVFWKFCSTSKFLITVSYKSDLSPMIN